MKNIPTTGSLDYIDPRTIRLEEIASGSLPAQIPPNFLIDYKFPIDDQLHQQACVAFGTARLIEIKDMLDGKPYRKVSAAYIWKHCKKDDNLPISSGTYDIQGVKSVSKYGYVYADEWDESSWVTQEQYASYNIPQNIVDLGMTRKMNYAGVPTNNPSEWKRVLSMYGGTTCPVQLSADWWEKNGVRTDQIDDPVPAPTKPTTYGHTMLAIGYDQVNKRIVNSWGREWSLDGMSWFNPLHYPPHSTAYYFIGKIPNLQVLPKITDFKFVGTNLRYKTKSDPVKQLQIALRLLGYLTSDEFLTGYYGDQTKKAVYRFQFENMKEHLAEINLYKGEIVGAKTNKTIVKKLDELRKKAQQVNSGSDVPVWIQSSQNPQEISLRVKAILLTTVPAVLFIASISGVQLGEDKVIEYLTGASTVIGTLVYLYGLFRSFEKKENLPL